MLKFADIEKEYRELRDSIDYEEYIEGGLTLYTRKKELFDSMPKNVQDYFLRCIDYIRSELKFNFEEVYKLMYTVKKDHLEDSYYLIYIIKCKVDDLRLDFENYSEIFSDVPYTEEDDKELVKSVKQSFFSYKDKVHTILKDDLCMDYILWRNGKNWKEYLARGVEDEKLKDLILNC